MVSDLAIIAVGFISMLGMILSIQLLNMNWFKRENFKLKRDMTKKEIDLKMRKMSRELGLDTKKGSSIKTADSGLNLGNSELVKALIPAVLKKLAPEDIKDLAEEFLPDSGESGGLGSALIQFANDNPKIVEEVVAPLLKGITQGRQESQEQQEQTAENTTGGFI